MLLILLVVFSVLAAALDLTNAKELGRSFTKTNLHKSTKFLPFNRRFLPSPSKNSNQWPSNGEQSLCTEATVSFTFIDYFGDFANLTSSLNLKLYNEYGNDYLQVSNANGWDSSHNDPLSYICYDDINAFGCNENLTNSYHFTLDKGDPYVDIDGYYDSGETVYVTEIYFGYANNGTLSNFDGTLFNSKNPCNTYFYSDQYQAVNLTTCCTTMSSAPKAPTNSSRCKRFRSRTTLYNNDYSIHATTAMNYTFVTHNQLITNGEFTAPNDTTSVTYYFTGGENCDSSKVPTLSCIINLPEGDSKTFITTAFWNASTGIGIPEVGMLLTRNDQTLMYEGIPFSTKNDCVYYTYKENDDWGKPTATEFCCKDFE